MECLAINLDVLISKSCCVKQTKIVIITVRVSETVPFLLSVLVLATCLLLTRLWLVLNLVLQIL